MTIMHKFLWGVWVFCGIGFLWAQNGENTSSLPAQVLNIAAMACRPNVVPEPGIPPNCTLDTKLVWAHYCSWHYLYNNYVRCQELYEHGLHHDSDILTSARREIAMAQACGINGFLVDAGGDAGIWETRILFKAAEGTPFMIGICQDFSVPPQGKTYDDFFVEMIEKFDKELFHHPNYPKIDGKPILGSFYATRKSAEKIQELRRRLSEKGIDFFYMFDIDNNEVWCNLDSHDGYRKQGDVFYSFVPSCMGWNGYYGEPESAFPETFNRLSKWAEADGKKYILSIHPGYIGRWLLDMSATIAFRGYDKIWDCFHAAKPGEACWVHLSTWNDYFETAIVPRAFNMGAYAEVFQAFVDQYFRQKPAPDQLEPRLYFAYDRETIPGTLLRIEALNAPIRRKGVVILSGVLLDNHGNPVAELEEKTLEGAEFDRCEWLIPTASLAENNALIPEITAEYMGEDGKRVRVTRRLPHAFFFTPWIQNNSQVRMPFHALVETLDSSLEVTQNGNLLEAKLQFNSKEPIIRATLWRNDRIVGDFRSDVSGMVQNFNLGMKSYSPSKYEVRLKNGRYTGSVRQYGFGPDMDNPWLSESSQIIPPMYIGTHSCQAVFQEGGLYEILKDDIVIGTVSPLELMNAGTVWFGDKDISLTCLDLNLASPVNPAPLPNRLEVKVLLNEQHETDQFYVHFLTEDGKSGFSAIEAPFCQDATPRLMTLLNTYIYSQSRASRLGYLDDDKLPKIQSTGVYPVNPLCVRRGLWSFDVDGRDSLGERPIFNANVSKFLKPEGPDGSNCLVLNADSEVLMRQRVYPIANCIIDFDLWVEKENFKDSNILISNNFYNSFDNVSIGLTKDGKVKVTYGKSRMVLLSQEALASGKWNHVKFVFKEHSALLYINDILQDNKSIPLWRSHFNGAMSIGDKSNGFIGKIDNLKFDAAWEE